ncbi:MAG: hypothetical protein JRJ38_12165 [Deltaproteobacteria bacterium]|nr:hypothetical protein [Deltaproteobacteria bacterium]
MTDCLNLQIQGKSRTCNVWLYPDNNLILRNLSLEPFDIVICDGPYGILEPACEWDDFDLNSKEGRERFRDYYRTLFDACLPHLRESASIFIFNYPDGASIIKYVLDEEYGLCFRRWIAWIYDNHHDFDEGSNFRRSQETILYYTHATMGFDFYGGRVRDIFKHPIIKRQSNEFRDGAKPLEVIRFLLNPVHRSGGRLLSLFAGSGTDIVAALEHDMDVVGFESDPFNYDMLAKRIQASLR